MIEDDLRRLRQEAESLRAELGRMQQQISEAHQMASIGRLLAGVVHEIKTPLSSIFSNAEVMRRSLDILAKILEEPEQPDLAKARRLVETCRSLSAVDQIACERISSIVRGLRIFARVETPVLQRVNLNENLRDTLKLTEAEYRGSIAVETDWGTVPEVECYPQMLSQAFLNILVNAAQAISGAGTITVRTRHEGEFARVSISDTGCGMNPEQQEKAFAAGFTTKPPGEGTGLGLAIARQIVEEKHGGRISFESNEGTGTTFHILIPIRHEVGMTSAQS